MSIERALVLLFREEGGFTKDPDDPGNWTGGSKGVGELKGTKYGISAAQYPSLDIENLTLDDAAVIYRRDYWDVCKCDHLPWPLSLFVFDAAVNQGCDARAGFAAQKLLQKALNLPQDGILGPRTVAAAAKARPWHAARFMAFRAMRYQGTRNYDKYGEGWLTRIFRLSMEAGK